MPARHDCAPPACPRNDSIYICVIGSLLVYFGSRFLQFPIFLQFPMFGNDGECPGKPRTATRACELSRSSLSRDTRLDHSVSKFNTEFQIDPLDAGGRGQREEDHASRARRRRPAQTRTRRLASLALALSRSHERETEKTPRSCSLVFSDDRAPRLSRTIGPPLSLSDTAGSAAACAAAAARRADSFARRARPR